MVGTVEPAHFARTAALYFHLGAATYADAMRTQVLMESSCARLAAMNPDAGCGDGAVARAGTGYRLAAYRDMTVGFHGAVYRRPTTQCSAC